MLKVYIILLKYCLHKNGKREQERERIFLSFGSKQDEVSFPHPPYEPGLKEQSQTSFELSERGWRGEESQFNYLLMLRSKMFHSRMSPKWWLCPGQGEGDGPNKEIDFLIPRAGSLRQGISPAATKRE